MARRTLLFSLGVLGALAWTPLHGQAPISRVAITDPAVIAVGVPAPLYRDPVYDGAADPVLVR